MKRRTRRNRRMSHGGPGHKCNCDTKSAYMAAKKRFGSCTKAPQFRLLSKSCKKNCAKKSAWINAGCRSLKNSSIKKNKIKSPLKKERRRIKRSKRAIQKMKTSLKQYHKCAKDCKCIKRDRN